MVSYWSSNLTLKRIWSILWTDHRPHLRMFSLSLLHHLFNIQSFLLGVVNGWSIAFALIYGGSGLHILTFCVYAYFLTLFHFSEFFMTALTNLESLRPDSFLLNHSPAYWTAAMCSWIEFWARAWIFPSLCSLYISSIGILCCIVGELFRKLAMCHASVGFTHQIAVRKHRDHQLCTKGVYSLVRHPGRP
uniref:Protein-S-isoprenylcysteine O-methyltransferase n=1 Tax=Globodera rostochiensis TaxID=31243 RepID=A0A914I838_GLORO